MINYIIIAFFAAATTAAVGYTTARSVARGAPRVLASTIGIIAAVIIFFGSVLAATIIREWTWNNAHPEMDGMSPMIGLAPGLLLLFLVFAFTGLATGWFCGRRRSRDEVS